MKLPEGRKTTASWWRGGAIYQVYPRSFADSNADDIGDLNGVTQHLDHIQSLGVDAIWLSPFFKSPMRDFGYDISDYRAVDPVFGTLEDFKALLRAAHGRGLKVIIDQVWSHTSDQHDWFTQSRQDRNNAKSDWYVWADAKPDGNPPNNWLSVFGGSAWTWDTRRRQYYLHNFLSQQPDLNFHCPEVQSAILDTARFWMDLGVDGFRLDVCNFYFHDTALTDNPPRADRRQNSNPHDWQAHKHCRSQPENLSFLAKLRAVIDSYDDRMLLGEIGDDDGLGRLIEYTSGTSRLHSAYSFEFLTRPADARQFHSVLSRWIETGHGWPVWAIGNHDFARVATRWGGGDPSDQKTRLFAAFQASLRGTICLYQGEELGLEQAVVGFEQLQDPVGKAMWPDDPGRDGCRTPMPWSPDLPQAGFSQAENTWLPVDPGHANQSAGSQHADPSSMLNFYRGLIAWRQASPAIRSGTMQLLPANAQSICFLRQAEHQIVLCCFNFSGEPVTLAAPDGFEPDIAAPAIGTGHATKHHIRLDPWSFLMIEGQQN